MNEIKKTNRDNNLKEFVRSEISEYFKKIDGYPIDNVYNLVISEVEKPLIEETLKYCKGNQTAASELLGLSRGTLRKKIKKYKIS